MSNDLVKPDTGEIVEFDPRLKSIPVFTDEIMESMLIKRVFDAPSLEDAMEPLGEADDFEKYNNEVITIHVAGLRPSTAGGKSKVFAIIDAEIESTKESAVITCGSPRVLAVIARAYAENRIPLRCKVAMGVPSEKGQARPVLPHRRRPVLGRSPAMHHCDLLRQEGPDEWYVKCHCGWWKSSHAANECAELYSRHKVQWYIKTRKALTA